jgi:hypothetical protein
MSHPIALALLILTSACTESTTALTAPTGKAQQVTMAPGDTVPVADGVRLRFDDVVSDNRCPTGVQCIVDGWVEMKVTVLEDRTATSYQLFFDKPPNAITHNGRTIEVVRVDPHPQADRTIRKGEYRATFDVRPE